MIMCLMIKLTIKCLMKFLFRFQNGKCQNDLHAPPRWVMSTRLPTQWLYLNTNIDQKICCRFKHLKCSFVFYSPQESKENVRTKSSPDGENIHETIKISKMSTRKIHSHDSTSTRKCETSAYNEYHECGILKYFKINALRSKLGGSFLSQ